jgi:2-keto-4-pentenoate hydratase/2-oxohepta-3-ene-1,7-dioic acid hydratase in catechol pathway
MLGPCVPRPEKVFGIGLNYRSHAEESGAKRTIHRSRHRVGGSRW